VADKSKVKVENCGIAAGDGFLSGFLGFVRNDSEG